MSTYLDLDRRFVLRTTYTPEELLSADITGRRLNWSEVLSHRFATIVAPANFGKTTELNEQVKRLRGAGRKSILVALRKVVVRGDLASALDTKDRDELQKWLASPSEPLVLFVDSLDEASFALRGDLEAGLAKVGRGVSWPNPNVRWVISTRPAVLTPVALSQLTSFFGVPLEASLTKGAEDEAIFPSLSATEGAVSTEGVLSEPLRVFSMLPLTTKQAGGYLRARCDVADANGMLDAARSHGLTGFTTSPGGLDVLKYVDPVGRPPACLTTAFDRVVDAVRQLHRGDRVADVGSPVPEKLDAALQKLSAASVVCQLPNIEVPLDELGETEGVLSARLVVGSILSEYALKYVLGTQQFIDAGLHQVKVYPDELLPFLAARRLAGLVKSPDHAAHLVESLSWSAATGEKGVYRYYLALAGWLATLSSHCREILLKVDPQAVAFFGDLRNREFPTPAAEEALRASIRLISEQGDRLGRGHFRLTSENFWQAGSDVLAPVLRELFQQYGHMRYAKTTLLNIVTNARSDSLRDLVLQSYGGEYAQLIKHGAEIHYLLQLDRDDDRSALTACLLSADSPREDRVAILVSGLGWRALCAEQIASLIDAQFRNVKGGYRIAAAVSSDLVESATDEQLYELTREIVKRLLGARRGRAEAAYHSRQRARYAEFAAELLTELVKRTEDASARKVASLCFVFERFICDELYGSLDTKELHDALKTNRSVRHAMLRRILSKSFGSVSALERALYGHGHICPVSQGDLKILDSAELDGIVNAQRQVAERAKAEPVKVRRRGVDGAELDKVSKKKLSEAVSRLRNGEAVSMLTWVAQWLLQTVPNSRYGDVDISALEREAGANVADAVQQGLSKLWRSRPPMYKETEPRSTYHMTVAGLQGLHLELGDGSALPQLTTEEVRQAIRYAAFEINGYPKWFWPVVRAHGSTSSEEFAAIINATSEGEVSFEHAEALMMALDEAPAGIRAQMAPLAWQFVLGHPKAKGHVIEAALTVATSELGAVNREQFEATAWSKVESAFQGGAHTDDAGAQAAQDDRGKALAWAGFWIWNYPETFCWMVDRWLTTSTESAKAFIFDLAVHLGEDRRPRLIQMAASGEHGVKALKRLYDWVWDIVQPSDDANHLDGQVYSVGRRENAEQLRDALVPAIASAKNQLAYETLSAIRLEAEPDRARYLSYVQFEMQEDRHRRPPIAQKEYDEFERSFSPPVSDSVSFAMAVHSDLLAVKYSVEMGEFSLRRFFSALSFARIDSEKDGLALEDDFQAFLASELKHVAGGRYDIFREPQLPEATRRDVLCTKETYRASIELKMSERWTVREYLEALEKQLVGQYMRERNANVGFLVLILQREREWELPESPGQIRFDGLLELLRNKALELEAKNRSLFLRVIGIDATPPEDFRATKAAARKTLGKKTAVKNPPAKGTAAKSASAKKAPTKPVTTKTAKSKKVAQ